LAGIGPGGQPGYHVELAEEAADDLIGVSFGAEAIELRHHSIERLFDFIYCALRIELALLLEALLALDEFCAVELGKGMKNRLALGSRIGQETGQAVP
jgi:hypothetical protein